MITITTPTLQDNIVVGKIHIETNQKVSKGDPLFNLEVGKGNHVIKATCSGTIHTIYVKQGQALNANQALCEIEEAIIEGDIDIVCPDYKMPGDITVTKITDQTTVNEGDCICEVEIGKGSYKITAPTSGMIHFHIKKQMIIHVGDLIATLTPGQVIEKDEKQENSNTTDLLIIGGGPGGYVAAIYAAQNGLKVTLVEKEKLGGTCLNVGCIPTKALVKSSEVMNEAKHGDVFGIDIKDVAPNIQKMMDHKEEVIQTLVNGVEYLMTKNEIKFLRGHATFKNDHTVIVERIGEVNAKNIIIATGSKISRVNIPGIDLPFVLDSTKALSYRHLPSSITIIGGGVIGMEFAFMYRNLGIDVHVIEFMDCLLTMIDFEASQEILRIAKEKGIHVHLQSKVTQIEDKNNHAFVTYEKDNQLYTLETENVLYAIGREPNMDNLNIEITGVEKNDRGRGIKVDTHMQTNIPHIYAIGDVTNIIQLAHVASEQGIIAVDNILGKKKEMHYHAVPNVIFTDPEIACVGLMEQELKNKEDYTIAKFNFSGNGKALTMNKNIGFVKLIKENKSNQIVGGTIIGPDASSLINALTIAIQNHLTIEAITETIFPHPTTGEAIHEAALGLGLGSIHA